MSFPPFRVAQSFAVVAVSALAASSLMGCGSTTPNPGLDGTPDAPPLTQMMNAEARAAEGAAAVATAGTDGSPAASPDAHSQSRVLAYVNGEVVNYRDVLLRVAPQLATVGTDEERRTLEERTLLEILRERLVHRAAKDAGIEITRDEIDKERARRIRELERNGGATLSAYLAERGMTRREYDEQIIRELRMQRYLRAAMGLGGEGAVRVRAVTDTVPAPRELRAYYDRNPEKFHQPEVARVRVMTFGGDAEIADDDARSEDARKRAEAALARLRAGEDWVPVYREVNARAVEPDPSDGLKEIREKGASMARWIEEFAFTKERGTLSEKPERKGPTYVVLRAEGYSPARQLGFDEVHGRILDLLFQLKRGVAGYEVELSLLEEAAITPQETHDRLRDYLIRARRRIILEAGL
jgi:hypothetical protein